MTLVGEPSFMTHMWLSEAASSSVFPAKSEIEHPQERLCELKSPIMIVLSASLIEENNLFQCSYLMLKDGFL